MAQYAKDLGIDSPLSIERVAWSTFNTEYNEALAKYFTEAGFPASPDHEWGIEFPESIPSSQAEGFKIVEYGCEAEYTPIPEIMQGWNDDQLGLLWDYWSEVYVLCLEAHGDTLMKDDIFSWESFVESFFTKPGERRFPADNVPSDSWGKTCPVYPPDKCFYGGYERPAHHYAARSDRTARPPALRAHRWSVLSRTCDRATTVRRTQHEQRT